MAARKGASETFSNPASGWYISRMRKIAPETASAEMNKPTSTVRLGRSDSVTTSIRKLNRTGKGNENEKSDSSWIRLAGVWKGCIGSAPWRTVGQLFLYALRSSRQPPLDQPKRGRRSCGALFRRLFWHQGGISGICQPERQLYLSSAQRKVSTGLQRNSGGKPVDRQRRAYGKDPHRAFPAFF